MHHSACGRCPGGDVCETEAADGCGTKPRGQHTTAGAACYLRQILKADCDHD